MKIFLRRILICCEVSYLNNNLIFKIFKQLQLVPSPFSDPTLLLIFAQFLINFLAVYNINTFEDKKYFSNANPFWPVKYPRRGTSGWVWVVLMSWTLSLQSFMLLRLDVQFFYLFTGLWSMLTRKKTQNSKSSYRCYFMEKNHETWNVNSNMVFL